jgi:CheY-like chemotaxis protein
MNGSFIVADSNPPFNPSPDPAAVSRNHPNALNPAGGDAVPARPKRSLNILCIDDDPHVRELLNDCLTHLGHRVKVATGGKEGLEMFRTAMMKNQPYDVIITDMGMPDIDGRQVARTIKAESPTMPVIMLTGWGARMKDDGDSSPGVDIVVSKPPRIQALNELLLRMAKPA